MARTGFKVVAGSKSVNGNKSLDMKGKSFKQSINHANSSLLGLVCGCLTGDDEANG